MATHRMDKVNELVREVVSRILLTESQDPRFKSVTVTGAKVSPDLHFARVFVSLLAPKDERKSILQALEKAAGHVRKLLGHQIRMKYTPQITFEYDESLERANKIYKTLQKLDLGDETETPENE